MASGKDKIADQSTHSRWDVSSGPSTLSRTTLMLTLVLHPRLSRVGERALVTVPGDSCVLRLSRMEPDFCTPHQNLGRPLGLPCISRKPLRLIWSCNENLRFERGDCTTRVRIDGIPLEQTLEIEARRLKEGVVLILADHVVMLLHECESPLLERDRGDLGLVGYAEAMVRIREEIRQVADLDVPVLIRGETGVGKELVAQALHRYGARRNRPFISVNLGALPESLAAAELFGAKRGSFTGATADRPGYFRAAHQGVLFLHGVGEAPAEVQGMLLRVLETKEIVPVGSHTPTRLDVRVLAATDAELEARIKEDRFKEPLLHRLAGYEIVIPPLRGRREDIGRLFVHFARRNFDEFGWGPLPEFSDPLALPWLPVEIAAALVRFSWPGNVRQLRNLVRQLIIGNRGQTRLRMTPQVDRILGMVQAAQSTPVSTDSVAPTQDPPSRVERRRPSEVGEDELIDAMRRAEWEPKEAARILGISRASIYDLVKKCDRLQTTMDLSPDQIEDCFRRHHGVVETMARELEVSRLALRRRMKSMGLN